jgi:hypothetical protein
VALRQDSEQGVTDAAEILVFLIWQLLHWLLFGCKNSQNSQKRPGRPFGEGEFGDPVRYRFLTKGELTSRRG